MMHNLTLLTEASFELINDVSSSWEILRDLPCSLPSFGRRFALRLLAHTRLDKRSPACYLWVLVFCLAVLTHQCWTFLIKDAPEVGVCTRLTALSASLIDLWVRSRHRSRLSAAVCFCTLFALITGLAEQLLLLWAIEFLILYVRFALPLRRLSLLADLSALTSCAGLCSFELLLLYSAASDLSANQNSQAPDSTPLLLRLLELRDSDPLTRGFQVLFVLIFFCWALTLLRSLRENRISLPLSTANLRILERERRLERYRAEAASLKTSNARIHIILYISCDTALPRFG